MNCPICKSEMGVQKVDVVSNKEEGSAYKEYNRTLYLCKVDDVWITTEIPKT